MPDSSPITQAHLQSAVKDVISHFNKSHGTLREDVTTLSGRIEERFDEVHAELEAIKEMLALRKDVERLERSLLRKGVLTEADLQKAG